MEKKEIVVIEEKENKGLIALSTQEVVNQVRLIQEIMDAVMKKDEHYGIIPGTLKPTLFKAGAEKLCFTFRLAPNYEIIREIRETDFIAYTIKCELKQISTEKYIGNGIGSCNSKENKYYYRYIEEEGISTEKIVPKEYWEIRKSDPNKAQTLLGGEGFKVKKEDNGSWKIYTIGKKEKVINENPWELDNVLIKMACKRAFISAVLNATAASDIFTQDLEDLPSEFLDRKFIEENDISNSQPVKPFEDHFYNDNEKSKFEKFLKAMAEEKERIGDDEVYYSIIKPYNHANEITTRKKQEEIFKALRSYRFYSAEEINDEMLNDDL